MNISLSEADTKAKLIDPALHQRGWTEDLIRREETERGIDVIDGKPGRRERGRIDYLLRVRATPVRSSHGALDPVLTANETGIHPHLKRRGILPSNGANISTQPMAIALIEAKRSDEPHDKGLEQAKKYARLNHVPFVYSSNGHLFVEYDYYTGRTSGPHPLKDFPTPSELRQRYEKAVGFSLESENAKPLLVPYPGGEASRRYYQDASIRAALEKIARGEKGCFSTSPPAQERLLLLFTY